MKFFRCVIQPGPNPERKLIYYAAAKTKAAARKIIYYEISCVSDGGIVGGIPPLEEITVLFG